MKKVLHNSFLGLLVLSLLALVGCGGSQGVIPSESLEEGFSRIRSDWRNSDFIPEIEVDKDGRFIRQSGGSDTVPLPNNVIRLTDLDNRTYDLLIQNIRQSKGLGTVHCHYVHNSGYLNIYFNLVHDEGKWWLDSVNVEDNSSLSGFGISGYIKDSSTNGYLAGASVQAFLVSSPNSVAGSAVTDSNGYYEIALAPGNYLLVVAKEGYAQTSTGPIAVGGSVSGQTIAIPNSRPTANGSINPLP